ncbi:M20/M25/M40 family metallo-hydrolase [Lachnoclostridium phytofermentans]|uniref:Peptidase T-like protein n=1 Tax=Lachnoclostridium phytofermentans (strain ATCC 700394 / DSM 18823 / ISDg) TaxID=357809 RepID=A9KHY9_LACP7|nr:M20/M25/M40 family metallo-hydrolase [Lachnoclostridium phytofermentans]ABX43836.1 peptidase T-like protein [Lachnoclostridium phytofermentans ISDg]
MMEERIVKEFCKLVEIDSPSFGEREIADQLKAYLVELGFEVREDKAGDCYNGNCGNIYGFLQGELPGDPILFSAHMDTVEPSRNKKAVVHEDGRITSDGTTVLGADDISGIVAILEAIRKIKEQGVPHRSIEVLFAIAEEVYILGSEVLDYSLIRAKEAYVLDLTGEVGTAALSAPTLVSFTAKMIGKAAHAGFAPENGINAIAAVADAIGQVKQGRIDEITTVNIGTISGGLAKNIVSEGCIIEGEARSLNHDKAVLEVDKIQGIFKATAEKYGAECEFKTSFGCIAYEIDKTNPVVIKYEKACNKLEIPTKYIKTFGGSDNNNFIRHGITGIVIASGMNKVHSTEEYTLVSELIKCSKIVYELMTV